MSTSNKPLPTNPPVQKNPPDSDDGLLDSIGKAITDPVKTGAEDEELNDDGRPVERPGG